MDKEPYHSITPSPTTNQPASTTDPIDPVQPNEPTAQPDEVLIPATAQSSRRPHKAFVLVIIGVIVVAGATVGGLLLFRHSPAKTTAVTPATTTSTQSAIIPTSDLQSDLNGASDAVNQSQTDQQSTDNSINDSSSQVAVPTE